MNDLQIIELTVASFGYDDTNLLLLYFYFIHQILISIKDFH